ncbi:MAG: hypothetical protein JWQ16_1659 [Novosphingobium sp.]|nr:hypothetical protein [Novosphingobium sp.]
MKRALNRATLLVGAALALTSAWAIAQDGPESLLPPGFDSPAKRPAREPAATPPPAGSSNPGTSSPTAPRITSGPVIQAIPGEAGTPVAPSGRALPPLKDLEAMAPEDLDLLLGIKPKSDMPAAARRAVQQTGVIDAAEGGLAAWSLAGQNASLVQAALNGNKGQLVSRWGHILLRRALASRLDAPAGMIPADFVAMRAALLLRMGEGTAARTLVQDVDVANYTPGLTQAALDSYLATADITGTCPLISVQGGTRKDPQWLVLKSICTAFSGDETASMAQLDRQLYSGTLPKIDMLLAQKYAGAAGKARRAVSIEWTGVNEMTPFRYAMALGTGVTPPAALMKDAGSQYAAITAIAPVVGLTDRAAAADRAGEAGVLSSAAMVDLYSQIYEADDITGDWADRASQLRDAYVAETPEARLAAMKLLWGSEADPLQRYSRQVLTAYSAARLPASSSFAADAGPLIAAMLAAGLDANALRWSGVVAEGSEGWALLTLADPRGTSQVSTSAFESFSGDDKSEGSRKSAFLLAGLAGLGRVQNVGELAGKLSVDLNRQSRWTKLIDQAAQVDNQALVCLLVGLGMQGESWDKMTPRYLYHIVSALNRVGLTAEARMIAAEAVARA